MMDASSLRKRAARCGLLLAAALSLAATAAADGLFRQGAVEFLFGTYSISEPRFTAVYPSKGSIQGLSFSAALPYRTNFYFEVRHTGRTGTLTYTGEKTTFQLIPLSAGVRYVHSFPYVSPYAGAGGDVYFYFENNPIGTMIDTATGFHLQLGAYFGTPDQFPILLNLRIKQTWLSATQLGRTLKLGGFEYGVGLVFIF